jgi:uncharacterized membrane protein
MIKNILNSFRNLNAPKTEAAFVLDKLLSLKNIKHTLLNAEIIASSEPNAENMFGYVSMLKNYNIAAVAGQVEPSFYPTLQQKTPFITHLEQGSFAVVDSFGEQNVNYYIHNQPRNSVSLADFEKTWKGIVLLPEFTERVTEKDYFQNMLKQYLPKIALLFITFTLLFLFLKNLPFASFSNENILSASYFFIKIIGFFITILLLKVSYFSGGGLANSFCNISKKANCNTILQSKEATLFGGLISWSEIGLFYFSGTLLSLIFVPTSISMLYAFSFLSFFFIFYSLYYQYFVLKIWCPLCLGVLACILGENLILALNFKGINFSLDFLSIVFLLLPVCIWYLLKDTLIEHHQQKKEVSQLLKFKGNQDIFESLLVKQPRTIIPKNIKQLYFGNPDAQMQITIISNPTCPPCAKNHAIAEQLLNENSENIGLNLMWYASAEDEMINTKVAQYFTEIYEQKGKETCIETMNDWFAKKNFDSLKSQVESVSADSIEEVRKMYQFCKEDQISHTPYILINNHLLPDLYELSDIRSFAG